MAVDADMAEAINPIAIEKALPPARWEKLNRPDFHGH